MLTNLDYLGSSLWASSNNLNYKIFITKNLPRYAELFALTLGRRKPHFLLDGSVRLLQLFCLLCLVRRPPVILAPISMPVTWQAPQINVYYKSGRKSHSLKVKWVSHNPAAWLWTNDCITLGVHFLVYTIEHWSECPLSPTLRLYEGSC